MQLMVLILEGLTRITEWLCHKVSPSKGSDRILLKHACPLLWFLLGIAGLSTVYFLGK
jgi:hypothetical protein